MSGQLAASLQWFIGAHIVPVIAGIILWRRQGDFPRLAAIWTLKPFLETPLYWLTFYLILVATPPNASPVALGCLALPGIILTVVILKRWSGDSFHMHPKAAWTLLALDTLRWASGSWLMLFGYSAAYVSLAMPTLFAVVALIVASSEPPVAVESSL